MAGIKKGKIASFKVTRVQRNKKPSSETHLQAFSTIKKIFIKENPYLASFIFHLKEDSGNPAKVLLPPAGLVHTMNVCEKVRVVCHQSISVKIGRQGLLCWWSVLSCKNADFKIFLTVELLVFNTALAWPYFWIILLEQRQNLHCGHDVPKK